MAFWGVEVKPGKPFTHSYDRVKGRLRISQATLAIGSSTKKSLVQCNIGNKSPVLLCALLPEKTESCQLDLEFEEADEVVFSVIGPRSVHLTGYYVGNGRHSNLNDDSDTYGEDIANTETGESGHCSDEDKYEDSFINDDDPVDFPPSPDSNGGVAEKMVNIEKPEDRKGSHKPLKKKYQSIESDDDTTSWKLNIFKSSRSVPESESESEDSFPISSLYKNKTTEKDMITETVEEKADKGTVETGNNMTGDADVLAKTEDDDTRFIGSNGKANTMAIDDEPKSRKESLLYNSLLPSDEVGPENRTKPKKNRKELPKEGKTPEADTVTNSNSFKVAKAHQDEAMANIVQDLVVSNEQDFGPAPDKGYDLPCDSLLPTVEISPENGMKPKKKRKRRSRKDETLEADSGNINALKEDKAQLAEAEANSMDQDLLKRNELDQNPTSNMENNYNSLLPAMEVGSENGAKAKRRRQELIVEGKSHEGIIANCSSVLKEDLSKQDEVKADGMSKDLPVRNEHEQKPASDKGFDVDHDQLADGNQSWEKKIKKKKKKKSGTKEKREDVDKELPLLSKEENNRSIMRSEDNNADARSSQVRTLSNGLIIEELETGKSDGKIAALGRKVKVQYIVKLKENGQVIDSNIGKAPYKFRLGDDEVLEGWNVGLDGMRVGDKRRLIIPPSMNYGSQGTGENIPPNSWLVYDVELLGVR